MTGACCVITINISVPFGLHTLWCARQNKVRADAWTIASEKQETMSLGKDGGSGPVKPSACRSYRATTDGI